MESQNLCYTKKFTIITNRQASIMLNIYNNTYYCKFRFLEVNTL